MHARRRVPHSPRQCRAIELTQPTFAWLIAAPPSNRARTHSTCPFWLAIHSGVAPVVCDSAQQTQSTQCCHACPHHLCVTRAAADDHGAPHPFVCDMGLTTSCPSPQPRRVPAHTTSCTCMPVVGTHTALGSAVPSSLTQPTEAWLIATPPSNSARTHSTCPFSLAMCSGVQPVVCHTTQHQNRTHHVVMPAIIIST